MDGGYYCKTLDNRPLIGPYSSIKGYFISGKIFIINIFLFLNQGGFSGFGVMGSAAGGELIASHILEQSLPTYAKSFLPTRIPSVSQLTLQL